MPLEACALDSSKHIDEVYCAGAGVHVNFVDAVVVSDAYFIAARHTHAVNETGNADWVIVRVVDRERPLEMRRVDLVEVPDSVVKVVRQIMDFGLFRLAVQIFELKNNISLFSIIDDASQPIDARRFSNVFACGEVIAAVCTTTHSASRRTARST